MRPGMGRSGVQPGGRREAVGLALWAGYHKGDRRGSRVLVVAGYGRQSQAMADRMTPTQRSRCMSRIRGKNTKPELLVRQLLHGLGYRYRLHVPHLPGRPDIVFPGRGKVIEVRGCFWHRHAGCPFAATPATRADFWEAKLARTVARDAENLAALKAAGWDTLILWGCAVGNTATAQRLAVFLGPPGGR